MREKQDQHTLAANELFLTAQVFEDCMDIARDADGLLCSDLNVDTMRPWTVDELSKAKAEIWSNWRHDPAGCMAYEDTLMATGRYIRVKVLHDQIAPGTPQIRQQAEGAVEAILAVAQAGERVESGYLPKPFGGLSKVAESKGISCDQIEHAALGLWQFRKQYPDSTLNAEIEEKLVRWTEYFMRRDWSYIFHGLFWHTLEDTPKTDLPALPLIHSLGLYMPLCVMSYSITGDQKYLDALNQKLIPILKRWLTDTTQNFTQHSNSCELLGMGAYFCATNNVINDVASETLQQTWRIAVARVSKDGLEYETNGVTDEHLITPHYIDPPSEGAWHGDRLGLWQSNSKSACSLCTAHLGVLAQKIQYDRNRAQQITHILAAIQNPDQITRMIDPDGQQIPIEHSYLKHTLWVQCIGAWLEATYQNHPLQHSQDRSCADDGNKP